MAGGPIQMSPTSDVLGSAVLNSPYALSPVASECPRETPPFARASRDDERERERACGRSADDAVRGKRAELRVLVVDLAGSA